MKTPAPYGRRFPLRPIRKPMTIHIGGNPQVVLDVLRKAKP